MKHLPLLFLAIAMLMSCSTAKKYSYKFDYYDYNEGRRIASAKDSEPIALDVQIADPVFYASGTSDPIVANDNRERPANRVSAKSDKAKDEITRTEKKQLRRELRRDLRELKDVLKSKERSEGVEGTTATAEMDRDLKLAIIFGAVGLTLSLFSGINAAFWVLGVIAIVVGVVFLIRWLIRQ